MPARSPMLFFKLNHILEARDLRSRVMAVRALRLVPKRCLQDKKRTFHNRLGTK